MKKCQFKKSLSTGSHKWWEKTVQHNAGCCYKTSTTLNVEISAYGLLTYLLAKSDPSQSLPILKWLLNQRNSNGGFNGTQDTVVGLEALAKMAADIASKDNNVSIEVETPDDPTTPNKHQIVINADNSLLLQSTKVSLYLFCIHDEKFKLICGFHFIAFTRHKERVC